MAAKLPISYFILSFFLLAGLTDSGCTGSASKKPPEDTLDTAVVVVDTTAKDTAPMPVNFISTFVPTLRVPINEGENLIYTVGFQLAWDRLRKIAGEKILMDPKPEFLNDLNNAPGSFRDISRNASIGVAGSPGNMVAAEFGMEFFRKFHGEDSIKTDVDPVGAAVVGYVYKPTAFGFRLPYYEKGLDFMGRTVDCFGIGTEGARNNWQSWVTVHDYDSPTDWVASISSDTLPDRLVIARMDNPNTLLLHNIYDIADRMDSNEVAGMLPGDKLLIPAFHFEMFQEYDYLQGKPLLNSYFNKLPIDKALHIMRIGLGYPGSASGFLPEPFKQGRNMILDGPFMLMIWEKGAPYPWMLMWVDNPQLMYTSP